MWQACLTRIKDQVSDDEFVKWFKPIVLHGFDEKSRALQLCVPNENYVYHIEREYISSLRPIIFELFGERTKLRYYFTPESESSSSTTYSGEAAHTQITQTDTTKIKNPFVIPGIKRLVIDSQLNPNLTFETFVEGECNRLARSAGYAVAIAPGETAYNPLYIFGDSGLGKTHVAQAIGMEIKQRHPDLNVLYVSMNKFQAQYTTAMANHEPNDFINFYQAMDVLIVDDIQELSGNKPATQQAFFNVFNNLHLRGKQVILTSDKRPSELKDISERLLTRFKWGLAAELTQPDVATKIKIIRNKAAKLGTHIPDEVITYFAENIHANVREVEGALSALVANAAFMDKKITISLAKEVLKVYVKLVQKEITIDSIRDIVCDHLKIDAETFDSPKRTREIAQARQIAMYLCKQHTKAPLSTIGAAIGGKNHATVLHACKAVSNMIETDKSFAIMMEELEERVRGK